YQPIGHVHLLTNMLDYGMSPQEALDFPRVFAIGRELLVEHGVPDDVREALADFGHEIVEVDFPVGGGQAITIDWDSSVLTAGSEPRKDGCALGY
ncbi:MAG: gamma-glutamyltransferase, partial [Alphaproteobacteria bacterium]|nr:gamma-glutamyltransferase [Alphaproteobacteria bacterium]